MPTVPTTTRAAILFLAAVVLAVEAAAAIALGLVQITKTSPSPVAGALAALLMLGYGGLLILVARGVAYGRRWARGPAVATQLLQGLLAYSFATGQTWWVAVALGMTALMTLGCLLMPSSTAVFAPVQPGEDPGSED
ncbi:MAG TPA: hypothetical protein VEQ66_13885 [Propionibacteriaceae bacterium]|nr:hypothetical protein [Propionibacteriaceae bacterium]